MRRTTRNDHRGQRQCARTPEAKKTFLKELDSAEEEKVQGGSWCGHEPCVPNCGSSSCWGAW